MSHTVTKEPVFHPSGNVSELLVELNDGFTAYYDQDKKLCRATPNVSRFAYTSLLPSALHQLDTDKASQTPQLVEVEKLIGYHCVLSSTGDPTCPWALSVFSDSKSITKIAHDLPVGVINVDRHWNAVFVNARCADMMKTSMDELYGRGWTDYMPPKVTREFQGHIMDKELKRSLYKTRMEFVSPLGSIFVFSVQLAAYFDHRDNFISATITVNDITKEFRAETKLQYMADHDPMTELLNRSAFIRKVEELEEAKFSRSLFVFVDLDKFKDINDTLGHKFGDRVLEVVARRIQAVVREQDLSARFGGDEFVICMPGVTTEKVVGNIAKKISNALNRVTTIEGKDLSIQCSIGIAWTPTIQFEEFTSRTDKVQAVVDAADQGMYEVKKGAFVTEHFKIYDVNLREQRKWLKNQKNELKQVLDKGELVSHFQPIYNLSGEIVSVESLARFTKPFEFFKGIEEVITFAKRNNMDEALFNQALTRALDGFSRLRAQHNSLYLNLNVDISQLEEENFSKTITNLCLQRHIPFTAVCVEVTENMLERNSARVEQQIEQLVRRGFLISMDDFGTGYSSFKRLMNYNFNELKIDRYFIENMLDTEKFRKTLKAMIGMGNSLGLQILAEGIETDEQYQMCRKMGVHLFQGFHFSRPVDSDTLEKMLLKQRLAS
ncbi:sensor domain-containing phosphodiesterase [Alteromonas sp. 1_MG-2023]|uniref:sensor domain-containing protein n=1 Tax=Alteromonas sp. 1_MG-2023 TaxID=3062669 RepID=UPI0026E2300E|nr:sensor domain-containing phosphodiesterase [Alteromonas sp. 1_MG-2023]MDO6475560.1 sensor domain-containing phosphodiesterase [Alteromonas sp. 1_MG-2023]